MRRKPWLDRGPPERLLSISRCRGLLLGQHPSHLWGLCPRPHPVFAVHFMISAQTDCLLMIPPFIGHWTDPEMSNTSKRTSIESRSGATQIRVPFRQMRTPHGHESQNTNYFPIYHILHHTGNGWKRQVPGSLPLQEPAMEDSMW